MLQLRSGFRQLRNPLSPFSCVIHVIQLTEAPGAESCSPGPHVWSVRPDPSPDLFTRSTSQPGPGPDTDKQNVALDPEGLHLAKRPHEQPELRGRCAPAGDSPARAQVPAPAETPWADRVRVAAAGTSCLLPPGSCTSLDVETCPFRPTEQAPPALRAACRGGRGRGGRRKDAPLRRPGPEPHRPQAGLRRSTLSLWQPSLDPLQVQWGAVSQQGRTRCKGLSLHITKTIKSFRIGFSQITCRLISNIVQHSTKP